MATSSSSHPKAPRRSRSTTGRSPARRCSGSARACSPGASHTSCSDRHLLPLDGSRARSQGGSRQRSAQPCEGSAACSQARSRSSRSPPRLRHRQRSSMPRTRHRPWSMRDSRTVPTSRSPKHPAVSRGPGAGTRDRGGRRVSRRSSPCSTASPTSAPTSKTSTACDVDDCRRHQLQDAYFQGGTARDSCVDSARSTDGILLSAETVKDFQLRPGDTVALASP